MSLRFGILHRRSTFQFYDLQMTKTSTYLRSSQFKEYCESFAYTKKVQIFVLLVKTTVEEIFHPLN